MTEPQTLTIAVCLCTGVTLSDFVPPMEILAGLNIADAAPMLAGEIGDVPYRVRVEYLGPTLNPIVSGTLSAAPTVNPTQTYAAALEGGAQYDIVWVPAGPFPDPVTGADRAPPEEIDFIRRQAPGAKYLMSVCEGSRLLALAGVLDGKRATTNKKFFKFIESTTSKKITWVPKARWVVDGKVWTASGVAAGSDMALAFVEHLAGAKVANFVRGMTEIPEREESDDPFAAFHGLI